MAKFKITDVSEHTDDWENNYGKYRSYLVRFQGEDQEQVQINRKKNPDGEVKYVPKVGDELEGSIEITDKGKKFKQDYSAGSSGSSGGNYQANKQDSPSPEYWASKDKRISRQHSQEMALRLLIANKSANQSITIELVKKAADAFDSDLPPLHDDTAKNDRPQHDGTQETKLEDVPF